MATVEATEVTEIGEFRPVGKYLIFHVRWDTYYVVDGKRSGDVEHHRKTYAPGADISDLPQAEQDYIAAKWTQEIIDAYNAAQQSTL